MLLTPEKIKDNYDILINSLWILSSGNVDAMRMQHKVIKMPCLKDCILFRDVFTTQNTNSFVR